VGSGESQINRRKHGVDFADAAIVFEDENALTIEDDSSQGERRWVTMGADGLGPTSSASFPAVRRHRVSGANTRKSDET